MSKGSGALVLTETLRDWLSNSLVSTKRKSKFVFFFFLQLGKKKMLALCIVQHCTSIVLYMSQMKEQITQE